MPQSETRSGILINNADSPRLFSNDIQKRASIPRYSNTNTEGTYGQRDKKDLLTPTSIPLPLAATISSSLLNVFSLLKNFSSPEFSQSDLDHAQSDSPIEQRAHKTKLLHTQSYTSDYLKNTVRKQEEEYESSRQRNKTSSNVMISSPYRHCESDPEKHISSRISPYRNAELPDKLGYHIRVFLENHSSSTFLCRPEITVIELCRLVGRKFYISQSVNTYRLKLYVIGKTARNLSSGDRPIAIQNKLLYHLGYKECDNFERLGRLDFTFYFKFVFSKMRLKHYAEYETEECVPKSSAEASSRLEILDLSGNPNFGGDLSVSQLNVLIMSFCELERLPALLTSANWIKILDLSHNCIQSISGAGLDHLSFLEVLNISHNRIMTLPDNLVFRRLRRLDISMNPLTKLPEVSLFSVEESLKFLDLSNCRITGEIPESICNLVQLTFLNISFNFFMGGIPKKFTQLSHLTDLDIRGNCLGQSINDEESIVIGALSKCPDLQVLKADGNRVRWIGKWKDRNVERGPNDSASFEPLKSFSPVEKKIGMASHASCLELCKIRTLSLSHQDNSSGFARPMIFCLSNPEGTLSTLNLSNSGLEELSLEFFSRIRGLEYLDLSGNRLKSLPEFTSLRRSCDKSGLDAHSSRNALRLSVLTNFKREGVLNLKTLNIADNELEQLPSDISELSHLESLYIQRNRLIDLPQGIWNCGSLFTINASFNRLTTFPGPILSEGYEEVDSSSPSTPYIESPQPEWSRNLRRLSENNVISYSSLSSGYETNLLSTLLSPFSRRSSQQAANLSPIKNVHRGFIPYGTLPPLSYSLRSLSLGFNALDCNESQPIFFLPLLEFLDLSHNRISDFEQMLTSNPIRSLLGPWYSHLQVLNLAGNLISHIPQEIGHLRALRVLNFSGNSIGSVPGEVSKIENLCVLDLASQFGGKNVGIGLRYNILNWPYEWNWNWNLSLRYLNLSGNRRLEIRPSKSSTDGHDLADFHALTNLQMLGLMDVTCMVTPPEEADLRRVRTTYSEIPMPCARRGYIKYAYADAPAINYASLSAEAKAEKIASTAAAHSVFVDVWDAVCPQFRGQEHETLFMLFDGGGSFMGAKLAKYLYQTFGAIFSEELSQQEDEEAMAAAAVEPPHAVPTRVEYTTSEGMHSSPLSENTPSQHRHPLSHESVKIALRRAFLSANQRAILNCHAFTSDISKDAAGACHVETGVSSVFGCSAVVVYAVSSKYNCQPRTCTLYVASVGDAMAVLSGCGGKTEILTQNHVYGLERLTSAGKIARQYSSDDSKPLKSNSSCESGSNSTESTANSFVSSFGRTTEISGRHDAIFWADEEWRRIHSTGVTSTITRACAGGVGDGGDVESLTTTRGFGYLSSLCGIVADPTVRHVNVNIAENTTASLSASNIVRSFSCDSDKHEFLILASGAVWSSLGGSCVKYQTGGERMAEIVRQCLLGGAHVSDDVEPSLPALDEALHAGTFQAKKSSRQINRFRHGSEYWSIAALKLRDAAQAMQGDRTRCEQQQRRGARGMGVMVIGFSKVRRTSNLDLKSVDTVSRVATMTNSLDTVNSDKSSLSSSIDTTRCQDAALMKHVLVKDLPSPPTGTVSLVFTDIQNSTELWELYPSAMTESIKLHNSLMRRLIKASDGYEVKTEGDAFMVAFKDPLQAIHWCLCAQLELLRLDWPIEIREAGGAGKTRPEDADGCVSAPGMLISNSYDTSVLFNGLKIRMGIHVGQPLCEIDPTTNRMDYYGPVVNRTARIASQPSGGQIYISSAVMKQLEQRVMAFYHHENAELNSLCVASELKQVSSQSSDTATFTEKVENNHAVDTQCVNNEMSGREEEPVKMTATMEKTIPSHTSCTKPLAGPQTLAALAIDTSNLLVSHDQLRRGSSMSTSPNGRSAMSPRRRASVMANMGWRPTAMSFDGEDIFEQQFRQQRLKEATIVSSENNVDDKMVRMLKPFGIHVWLVGDVKLKGLEIPETIFAIYPRELKDRHHFLADSNTCHNLLSFSPESKIRDHLRNTDNVIDAQTPALPTSIFAPNTRKDITVELGSSSPLRPFQPDALQIIDMFEIREVEEEEEVECIIDNI